MASDLQRMFTLLPHGGTRSADKQNCPLGGLPGSPAIVHAMGMFLRDCDACFAVILPFTVITIQNMFRLHKRHPNTIYMVVLFEELARIHRRTIQKIFTTQIITVVCDRLPRAIHPGM